jgi:hypothetical protein
MSSYDLFGAAVKPATATASQINLNPTLQAANIVPVQQGGKYVMAIRSAQTGAISKIGQDTGKEISQLSGQVLDKVRASDSGEFGTGMKKILDLTSGVKLDKLGEETGLISKLTGLFSRGKNAVTHQFDSVKDEITRVADGLRVGVARMEDEAVWLEKARAANEVHQHEYELLHADLLIVVEEEKQKLAAMPQDDAQAVADQRQRVESFERHAQKIFKLIHLTKLTTPEICGLQVANRNLIEKFNDLVDITIPAWGKQISLALIGARQAKDAAVAIACQSKDLSKRHDKKLAKNQWSSSLLAHFSLEMRGLCQTCKLLFSTIVMWWLMLRATQSFAPPGKKPSYVSGSAPSLRHFSS